MHITAHNMTLETDGSWNPGPQDEEVLGLQKESEADRINVVDEEDVVDESDK